MSEGNKDSNVASNTETAMKLDESSQKCRQNRSSENGDSFPKEEESGKNPIKVMKCIRIKRKVRSLHDPETKPYVKEMENIQKLEKLRLKEEEAEMKRQFNIEKERLRIELRKAKLEERTQKHKDQLNKSRERLERQREVLEAKTAKKLAREQVIEEKRKLVDEKNRKIGMEQQLMRRFFTPVSKKTSVMSSHWLFRDPDSNMVVTVRCLDESDLNMLDEILADRMTTICLYKPPRARLLEVVRRLRYKLIKFHDNNRPAYYGTWKKTSSVVNGRTPLGKDEIMDYEVDSDAEWVEEEPGENLTESEKEPDEDEGDDSDDSFLVPDGHLSVDEGASESEMFAANMGGVNVLKRTLIGCVWGEGSDLDRFRMVEIPDLPEQEETKSNQSKRQVPEEAMPFLIRLCHGNPRAIQSLITEFQLFWIKHKEIILDNLKIRILAGNPSKINVNCPISRRQLELKMGQISKYEKRDDKKKWYVHDDVLRQYGLEDLSPLNEWEYLIKND